MKLAVKIIVPTALFLLGIMFFVQQSKAITDDDFFQNIKNLYGDKVVAFYTSGLHGVVGEEGYTHQGKDIVIKACKECDECHADFIQWFWGLSSENGGKLEGDKSIWRETTLNMCPAGQVLVKNAYPAWGDYLKPGANYCVQTFGFSLGDSI